MAAANTSYGNSFLSRKTPLHVVQHIALYFAFQHYL